MDIKQVLEEAIARESSYLYCKEVDMRNVSIEERVFLQCFHCKNYNSKWTCPSKIPQLDYKKLFNEYKDAMLVYCKIPFSTQEEFEIVRKDSTNIVHKTLINLEKVLYNNNRPMAVSFIGGSCKLCKDGCAKDKCRFPHASRIPLEATGVNVIKLVKEATGIDVVFPPQEFLYRFGLLLW